MHLEYRNVNEAFHALVYGILSKNIETVKTTSRYGNVLQVIEPALITYTHPRERVLFCPARDVNPFFHLYEALWMLAGRNDVASVAYYCPRMKEFSDSGVTLNGAYGYRWRHFPSSNGVGQGKLFRKEWPSIDQLAVLVNHLKVCPDSRRAVLQMWNVEDDLMKIGVGDYPCCEAVRRIERVPGDATTLIGGDCPIHGRTTYEKSSKDVCCNTSVMFAIRKTICPTCEGEWTVEKAKKLDESPDRCPNCDGNPQRPYSGGKFLDMTVTNRSNDMIWGLLGTNYVHFSILMEYLAGCLGIEVGNYHHFSNNLHVYEANWDPEKWVEGSVDDYYLDRGAKSRVVEGKWTDEGLKIQPLMREDPNPDRFDKEVREYVERHSKDGMGMSLSEPFLVGTAQPMSVAFHYAKRREYDSALNVADTIKSEDWRIAALHWIRRRQERRQRSEQSTV